MPEYISKKRLYLDADGKVTDDDSKGVSLLVGENGTLVEVDAVKHGLTNDEEVVIVTEYDEDNSD